MAENNNNNDLAAHIAALNDESENNAAEDTSSAFTNSMGEEGRSIAASDDMQEFLNIGNPAGAKQEERAAAKETVKHAGDLPPDLPFMHGLEEPQVDPIEKLQPAPQSSGPAGPAEQLFGPAKEKGSEAYAFFLWAVKSVLPYVVIFAIGLGLYFFYFSDFSINSLFKSNQLTIESVAVNNKDLDKLKKDQATAYSAWMKQFFFEVNDDDIISMDTDVSGNGLTNFEKYLLNLNPKVYSTRGSNDGDGQLVLQNINPWTGKPFTDQQKELVDKYINKELISNRITAAALSRGVTKFAQYVSTDSPYYIDPANLAQVSQNNPTTTPSEVASNQAAAQAAQQASNNAGSNNSLNLNSGSGINLAIAGKLDIPANNISVPLTWTKDVKDFDADLKKGLVHYPGTVMPGEIGTSYISGHSSGYIWDHSPYKTVFAVLGQVKDGTSFTITATQNDGKIVIFHYVVDHRGEYQADDQAQFVNTADSIVALSTCWPVGTTARRLVLFAKLTQTEHQ
ncbi:MAG TPA: sortase [Patescibacteria group bacterium]|jgi:LPXTG-site transpeptidase (sortase) family protein|nr:sortase [Patescibacteria group bacterium]